MRIPLHNGGHASMLGRLDKLSQPARFVPFAEEPLRARNRAPCQDPPRDGDQG